MPDARAMPSRRGNGWRSTMFTACVIDAVKPDVAEHLEVEDLGRAERGSGPPYTTRTCDRSLRRRVLYPTELRADGAAAASKRRAGVEASILPQRTPGVSTAMRPGARQEAWETRMRAAEPRPAARSVGWVETQLRPIVLAS